ncbi:MAG: acetyl-CoA carboxylase biotin carboxyl carrier protein subunit [Telmatospirillum sp.]|nr:acetyl-CoA carboxylase biotin carboxyl carrier protein subunit [Telmatospirillum sp.]
MDVARLQQAIKRAIAARGIVEYAEAGREIRVDASATMVPSSRDEVPADAAEATADPNAVVSPCFGIVHLSPSPGAPQFVRVGDIVVAGQKVCLVEAMKVFSAVVATAVGRVAAVCVAAGDEVAQGQTLFRLERPSGDRDV